MKRKTFVFALLIILILTGCSKEDRWSKHYDLGIKFLSEGNYAEAIQEFSMAIKIDPARPEAYVGRGDAYLGTAQVAFTDGAQTQTDNLKNAEADFRESFALEYGEETYEHVVALSKEYLNETEIDEAMELLNWLIEEVPDQAPGYAARGDVWIAMAERFKDTKDMDEWKQMKDFLTQAEEDYRKAMELDPGIIPPEEILLALHQIIRPDFAARKAVNTSYYVPTTCWMESTENIVSYEFSPRHTNIQIKLTDVSNIDGNGLVTYTFTVSDFGETDFIFTTGSSQGYAWHWVGEHAWPDIIDLSSGAVLPFNASEENENGITSHIKKGFSDCQITIHHSNNEYVYEQATEYIGNDSWRVSDKWTSTIIYTVTVPSNYTGIGFGMDLTKYEKAKEENATEETEVGIDEPSFEVFPFDDKYDLENFRFVSFTDMQNGVAGVR